MKILQEFPHFFGTNTTAATAKWETAKQRAPEPPLFQGLQPRKAQHEDVVLSLPEHCHKWRELLVVEQPFTWPIETHFHFQLHITSPITSIHNHQTSFFGETPIKCVSLDGVEHGASGKELGICQTTPCPLLRRSCTLAIS